MSTLLQIGAKVQRLDGGPVMDVVGINTVLTAAGVETEVTCLWDNHRRPYDSSALRFVGGPPLAFQSASVGIDVGDIVQLNSGSPQMTVVRLDGRIAAVTWFTNGYIRTDKLDVASLTLVPRSRSAKPTQHDRREYSYNSNVYNTIVFDPAGHHLIVRKKPDTRFIGFDFGPNGIVLVSGDDSGNVASYPLPTSEIALRLVSMFHLLKRDAVASITTPTPEPTGPDTLRIHSADRE